MASIPRRRGRHFHIVCTRTLGRTTHTAKIAIEERSRGIISAPRAFLADGDRIVATAPNISDTADSNGSGRSEGGILRR